MEVSNTSHISIERLYNVVRTFTRTILSYPFNGFLFVLRGKEKNKKTKQTNKKKKKNRKKLTHKQTNKKKGLIYFMLGFKVSTEFLRWLAILA